MRTEDQEWFDALAGKVNNKSPSESQIEAASVRRVLLARRESIEQSAVNYDAKKLGLLKRKLAAQGFLQDRYLKSSNFLMNFMFGIFSGPSGAAVAQKVGAIALILLVGFAVRVSYLGPKNDNTMLVRGDINVTYIIDEKPEQKLGELVAGLTNIKAEYTQEKESYGKTLLKIKSTEEVISFLGTKRIEPKVVDGYISIIVTPPEVQAK